MKKGISNFLLITKSTIIKWHSQTKKDMVEKVKLSLSLIN
jgi:hypothetical protein